ncbi:MAG: hypothetical protein KC516_03965 [Nanoarchaeota archaeon]|nr:hypothetical protein [Nanoarchaeota archaeon]
MNLYPVTNILLKDKNEYSVSGIHSELEVMGKNWHQNIEPGRKEIHYFMGDSSVVVLEYEKKVNIKLISQKDIFLSELKSKIEKIVDENYISNFVK